MPDQEKDEIRFLENASKKSYVLTTVANLLKNENAKLLREPLR